MRSSLHRLARYTGLASAFLLVAAASPAVAAVSAPASEAAVAPLAGTLVAQGRLTTVSGSPAAGAHMFVYAWPALSVVSKVRMGHAVPLKLVGTATTASSGAYALRVSSPSALSSAALSDGTVNLEIISTSPTGGTAYNFTRRLAAANGRMVLAAPAARVARAAPLTENLRLMRTSTANGVNGPKLCVPQLIALKNLGARPVVIGAAYSRDNGVTVGLNYSHGQSSSLGVGVSANDEFDSFRADGTFSASSTATESFPSFSNKISHTYATQFSFERFEITCGAGFEVRVRSFAGGATTARVTSIPKATFCVTQAAGSSFKKNSTTAFTFSGGASLATIIGLNLSARTGYSASAQITFKFTQRHNLCGTNGFPGGNAQRLVAS